MCYYVLETQEQGTSKIVGHCHHYAHRYNVINQYCEEREIEYVEKEEDIFKDGIYCVKRTDDLFEVIRVEIVEDGYVFNGYITKYHDCWLKMSYYLLKGNSNIVLQNDLITNTR